MNRILSVLSVTIITLFIISCQKEVSVDTTNSPAGVTGNFKAKIDGNQWVADKATGAWRLQGLINISGISVDKKILSITLTDSGVHTYTLDDVSLNAAAYIDSSEVNPYDFSTNQGINPGDAGGTLTITKIDTDKKTISGTFQFSVFRQYDSQKRVFTEGSFTDISYGTTLPPAAATDTFHVKIDGTLWSPASLAAVSTNNPAGSAIAISATEPAIQKTVGLIFPPDITPGSYTLDFFGGEYIGQYNPDTDPMHAKASTSGTLTILEHNTTTKRIRGTFNFHGEEILDPSQSAELTEGYFSVTYQ